MCQSQPAVCVRVWVRACACVSLCMCGCLCVCLSVWDGAHEGNVNSLNVSPEETQHHLSESVTSIEECLF